MSELNDRKPILRLDTDAILAYQVAQNDQTRMNRDRFDTIQGLSSRAMALCDKLPSYREPIQRATRHQTKFKSIGVTEQGLRVDASAFVVSSYFARQTTGADGAPRMNRDLRLPRPARQLLAVGALVRIVDFGGGVFDIDNRPDRESLVCLGHHMPVDTSVRALEKNWPAAADFLGQTITALEMYTKPDSDVVIDPSAH
ncbi:MAG: hypothetical protein WBP26_03380 [Candidatus Saccharimonadales bacterium]